MVVISCILYSRICIQINKMPISLRNVCTNCIRVQMLAGLLFITIHFNIRKYWLRNMAVMAGKQQVRTLSIQWWHFRRISHPTDYYFIRVTSFRKNTGTVHLLLFTVPGTAHRNHRRASMLHSYLSKTESHPENGRYLQMDFQEVPRIPL